MLVALALALLTPVQSAGGLPFEELGRALLGSETIESLVAAAPSRSAAVRSFLERNSRRLELGAVELWIPRATLQPDGTLGAPVAHKVGSQLAQLLLRSERRWIERLSLQAASLASARKDLNVLDAWMARAKGDLLDTCGKRERDAAASLRQILLAPTDADREAAGPASEPLFVVLAPTRAHYLGLIGFAGLVDPSLAALWLEVQRRALVGGLTYEGVVLAMEMGPAQPDGNPFSATPISAALLEQNLVHRASHLFSQHRLRHRPVWLDEGLACVDTIEVCGDDETLCFGAFEQPDELQPPGSPLRSLLDWITREQSPYREGAARKFFQRELAAARSGDGFEILDLERCQPAGVWIPPLLGAVVDIPPALSHPPPGVSKGMAEFFRAYAAACVHWLDEEHEKSGSALALVWRAAEASRSESQFQARLQSLFGRGLGASRTPGTDLEGAFLRTLSGQR